MENENRTLHIFFFPYKNVTSESESFVIPNLPSEIKMTRMQTPDFFKHSESTEFTRLLEEAHEAEVRSYGVIVNSFYELEHDYVNYCRKELGRKTWHIGPMFLCNKDLEDKACRGKDASINERQCLKWLDTKQPNSVVYLCFGSETKFLDSQLREIALGLEALGQQFIWVVRKTKKDAKGAEEWLPEGIKKRVEGKGLIISCWALQVLILKREATGAFVTHCGSNSMLEGGSTIGSKNRFSV